MPATIRCSRCGGKLEVSASMVGKPVRCPGCGTSAILHAAKRPATPLPAVAGRAGTRPAAAVASKSVPVGRPLVGKPLASSPGIDRPRPAAPQRRKEERAKPSRSVAVRMAGLTLGLLLAVGLVGAGAVALLQAQAGTSSEKSNR